MRIPTAIFFDVLNTLLDMSSAKREDIERYASHRGQVGVTWFPLDPPLPATWLKFPAWPDVHEGIDRLRDAGIKCYALSNVPSPMLTMMLQANLIALDEIVPLEKYRVYKPHVSAYQIACECAKIEPHQGLMVTANEKFGDIEGANSIGMRAQLIDRTCKHFASMKSITDLCGALKAK